MKTKSKESSPWRTGMRCLFGAFSALLTSIGQGQTPSGTYPTSYGVYEATLYQPGITYSGFRLTDMNGDGAVEVIAARYSDGIVEVWEWNRVTGLLERRDTVTFGGNIHDVDAIDFDHDGDVDIAVAIKGNGLFVALNGAGPGAAWGAPWTVANIHHRYGWQVGVADFNMDGYPDLFHGVDNGYVHVFRGVGDGTFVEVAAPTPVAGAGYRAGRGLTAIDVDADDHPDLIGLPSERFGGGDFGYLRAHLNTGTAGMIAWSANIGPASPIQFPPPNVNSTVNCAADMNQDGFVDQLFVMDNGQVGMMWGASDVSGLSWSRQDLANLATTGLAVQLADVNDDGWMDFGVYSPAFSGLRIFLNNRAGGFAVESITGPAPIGYYWRSLAGGDVDGDGRSDLVASRNAGRGLLLYHRINTPPIADAGDDQAVQLGSTAYLDGSGSTDDFTPTADLAYAWSIKTAPAGSAATLTGADTVAASFTPDLAGDYTVELTVTDGAGLQDTDETVVTVTEVLANGSFEAGLVGWSASGNMQVQSPPAGTATDGVRLLAFGAENLPPTGVLSQAIPTIAGQAYRLEFDVGVLDYVWGWQALGLKVQGNAVLREETVVLYGQGGGRIVWRPMSYVFTADSAQTIIEFKDRSVNSYAIDLLLDHVRVTPLAATLLVASQPASGLAVTVQPADTRGAADGVTPFQRVFNPDTAVTLTAPAEAGGQSFDHWAQDGAVVSTSPQVEVVMDGAHRLVAVYAAGPPVITQQPTGAVAVLGGTAAFSVTASGAAPLTWQWRFNGTDIPGANSPELVIDPVTTGDAGTYDVVVSNGEGSVTSDPAELTVSGGFTGLENGSFEAMFEGWTVHGNVWVQQPTGCAVPDGVRIAAFNAGNTLPDAELSQVFTTTPGQTYLLEFDMGVIAYNTWQQVLEVEVTGSPALLSRTFTINGTGNGMCRWVRQNLSFIADSTRTTLAFRDRSTATHAIDLLLDRIKIEPLVQRRVVIQSTPITGVPMALNPADADGAGNGVTPFNRRYLDTPLVTIATPAMTAGYRFTAWLRDGTQIATDPATSLTFDSDCTLTAVYEVAPPQITVQPADAVCGVGASATFQVTATGIGPFTYEWRVNGAPVPGSDADSYTKSGITLADDGSLFEVVITNGAGSTTSRQAKLTVVSGSLVNGSFESGFDGWTGGGVVEIQTPPAGSAPDGSRIVAFNSGNRTNDGWLSQTFATTPGHNYLLTFDMGVIAYNTYEQRLQVDVTGSAPLASAEFIMFGAGGGRTIWQAKQLAFTADHTATTVTFFDNSIITFAIDLLVDDVRIEPLTFMVTTLTDENDGALGIGSGDSLREVIEAAAEIPGVEVIRFAAALNGGTIALSGTQLTVDSDLIIDASSLPAGISVSGSALSRVFEIATGRTVSMTGLAVIDGYVFWDAGELGGDGGGIQNLGTLTLDQVTVAGNEVQNNSGQGDGGGICNNGTLVMIRSTVSGNRLNGGWGGGISNFGNLMLVNSTVSGNRFATSGYGGGIWSRGNVTLRHSTVSNNDNHGVQNLGGELILENSIVAGNGLGGDLLSVPVQQDLGANLIGGDPKLAPLANYGGRTATMPPLGGSPAVDAAIALSTTPATDQRGLPRIAGPAPDIGAVESVDGFSLIPTGTFQMGDALSEGSAEERPVHAVFVSAFYMAKHEVSKALWNEVCAWGAAHGYTDLPYPYTDKTPDHPVDWVRWHEMVKWCNARSEKDGLTPCYTVAGATYRTGQITPTCNWRANGYRLPTEAEWEKAARGGLSGKRYPWGDTISYNEANYAAAGTGFGNLSSDDNPYNDGVYPCTAPVGSFPPNGYGLYDMAGNVFESCWDSYSGTYYVNSPDSDPKGPAGGDGRVFRGGSWDYGQDFCRVAFRSSVDWSPYNPKPDYIKLGFRVARSVPAEEEFSQIPAGNFLMGDTFGEGFYDEDPVHPVSVSTFYMARHEVTMALWNEVRTWALTHGYTDLPAGDGIAAVHPVNSIDWFATVKWCNARSEMEGLTPCYTTSGEVYRTGSSEPDCDWSANGYRLPTEAEWEKAARGGLRGKRYPWGDKISHNKANYYAWGTAYGNLSGNAGYHPIYAVNGPPYTSPVGSFAAHGYGMYDMTGNVQEWCWDWFSLTFYEETMYEPTIALDPRGPASGSYRVARGGGSDAPPRYCRVAYRGGGSPTSGLGFRLARSSFP